MKSARPSFFVLIALIGGLAILSSTLSKTPVLPLFAHALHATPAEIGWIVMASTIPGILISYPAGALSDYLGSRRLLLASLVVFATAPFLYLLVKTAPQLMVGMNAFVTHAPSGLLDSSAVLPVQIFIWADRPERGFTELTSAAIMMLLVFLVLMNGAAIALRSRFERRW